MHVLLDIDIDSWCMRRTGVWDGIVGGGLPEERQIFKLTLELGGSVAEMARALGVNASPTRSERG